MSPVYATGGSSDQKAMNGCAQVSGRSRPADYRRSPGCRSSNSIGTSGATASCHCRSRPGSTCRSSSPSPTGGSWTGTSGDTTLVRLGCIGPTRWWSSICLWRGVHGEWLGAHPSAPISRGGYSPGAGSAAARCSMRAQLMLRSRISVLYAPRLRLHRFLGTTRTATS